MSQVSSEQSAGQIPSHLLFRAAGRPGDVTLGWEHRPMEPAVPFPERPPVPHLPMPLWLRDATAELRRAKETRDQLVGWAVALAVVPLVIMVAAGDLRVALVCLAAMAGGVTLATYAPTTVARARQRLEAEHGAWIEECMRSLDTFAEASRAWDEARRKHEEGTNDLPADAPMWAPLVVGGDPGRLDVNGGSAVGWRALVATLGASALAGQRQLTVIDLSERSVASQLVELAKSNGRRVETIDVPKKSAAGGSIPRPGDEQIDVGVVTGDPNRLLEEVLPQLLTGTTGSWLSVSSGRVLILAGADRVEDAQLRTLDKLARLRGVRLVNLFKGMPADAAEVLNERRRSVFMRLPDPTSAAAAAELMDHGYTLTLSRVTAGPAGTARPAEEVTVRTSTVQMLPDTALVLVELDGPDNEPIARLADCDPAILTLERVSTSPVDRW